jgi:DNA-binding response OmpR family regulator
MNPKTVLIVEDEAVLRKILQDRLRKEGFNTLLATDGAEGLELALRKHPDLILLDIMMPHDGLGMLNSLREDESYGKSVPVIFLTNLSPDSDKIISSIERHEPAFFLVKANHSPEQVVEKVQEALAK